MKRISAIGALLLIALVTSIIYAANVVTDGTMEAAGITSWPLTNVSGTATAAKATDFKAAGTQSLRVTSQTANRNNPTPVEWYDSQTVGTIAPGNTVTLSLWWGVRFNGVATGGAGTLYVDLVNSGGTVTTVWSNPITPSLTFASGTVSATDISAQIASSSTYTLRLRFVGTIPTDGNRAATIQVWWDNVVLDVTSTPISTTIGDGTDPVNAALCPTSSATFADAFTFQSNRNSTVSAINVALGAGAATGLSLVEITNDSGAIVYGSVSNPASDTLNIPLSTSITSTTTATQYRIRVTPRGHAAPAGVYTIAARVAAITSDAASVTNNDAGDTALTIDNAAPANGAWTTNSASDGSVTLNWTNPGADFSQALILRSTSTPITAVPVDGTTYALDATIGTATVRYDGNGTTATDNAVANGTTYYYKLFSRDACGNYSPGVESAALRPDAAPQTTTVGNGTDPSPSASCPGGGTTNLDAFTLQTTGGSDAISGVTVTLSSGAGVLAKIEITDAAGSIVYGFVDNPPSTEVAIPTTGLSATTVLTPYAVRVTPKSHASMPAGNWSIGGTVTAITSANTKIYGDTAGSSVSIDNEAPPAATWGSNTIANATITLAWTRPADAQNVVVLRSTSTPVTTAPADGAWYVAGNTIGTAEVRYAGSALSFADTPLTNGTQYHYRIFARDACGNYSAGVDSGALTPSNLVPGLTAGTGNATVDSCNQITVRAPFTGDAPSNSTTTFERSSSPGGPWTTACASVSGATPRTCVMSGLTPGATYYARVTFADADGISGQNPQLVGPFSTPSVCSQANTAAGAATAIVNACRQISLTAPFTGDGDNDGAVRVEYNTTNSWPGTTACATASGPSPRQCLVTPLNPSTQYWLRASYSDPDGVSGTATQVVGPLTTTACGADSSAPMVLFLSPARGATIGGTEKFKVQIWDGGTLAATNPVRWSVDGGALSTSVVANTNYACGAGCRVYEFDVATAALAAGAHTVTVQATDTAGNVGRVALPITVSNTAGGTARGSGMLLRRTHGSQLCVDCHAIASHTSQEAGSTKYGSWANDCLSCHTPHLTTNIKLVRTEIVTPNSGVMQVDLRTIDTTGGTNPQNSLLGTFDPSGAPFNDGVCEVCHTRTLHHRNDASGGDHTHYQNQRCTGCHTHANGFKGTGCNGCHSAPPSVGRHRTKHDEVWDSTAGNTASSYDDAAPHATATQYGFSCASCHAGTHADDDQNPPHDGSAANPWQAQVLFQGKNATAGASYAGTYNQNAEQGPNGQYFSWSNGTCSSGYCHSNAAPLGGQNFAASVTWNGAPTTCSSCHRTGGFGDGANDDTFLSKSHATHIQSSSTETGSYAFRCSACHASVVSGASDPWALTGGDLIDKRLHVNEDKQDVSFTAIGSANQSGATYDGAARTCTSSYCHSQGTSTTAFAAPNANVAWGQTASCITCHDGNATQTAANRMSTGRHGQHIDITTTYGQNVGCAACHATTVSADATINATTGYTVHVNGTRDVSGTSVGAWTTPTCASSRCHSSGVRSGTLEYYTVNWATGSAITDCKGCHGRHSDNAFASVAGEPNYANVPASNKFNSHNAHVAAATDCRTCHNSTIATSNRIDGSNPAKHMDFDGLPDITFAAPYAAGTYNSSSRTCTVGCHGSGAPVWGGPAILCLGCHSGTEGDALGNGIPNGVSVQWTTKGHGSAAGGAMTSALNGCDYCHDLASAHSPTASTNPYRLRFSATDNTLCLKCHDLGDTGIGVNSVGVNLTLENSSRDVEEAHFGAKHQAGEGGSLCWDCHDPHGTSTNILMIRSNVSLAATAYGVPTVTKAVTFTARATAADFIRTTGLPRTGICQACHDPAKGTDATLGSTKYWRWDGTDVGGGASTHYATQVCSDCHKHNKKFAGAGGNCLGCHGDGSGAPGRRPVNPDFADGTTPNFRSHHVGNGTANALKGTLNNFDCVVCHAEGKRTADGLSTETTGQPHIDGKIDLRNVDSATAYFTYDKDAVEASAGTNLAQWSSANAVWRTQTSTALDPFCLGCHDSDGATQAGTLGETGAIAKNPFKDTAIANNYDQLVRPGPVDIKSKVTGTGTFPDFAGGTAPPQGTFSRHAIRRQYKSVYNQYTGTLTGCNGTTACKPVYDYNLFVQNGTDEFGRPNWNDASVMGCADCHTTDGANGATGNAHGSTSEYLLKDASGGATEGKLATLSYICFRCHTADTAIAGNYTAGNTHADNGGDYQDYTGAVGTGRVPAGNTGGSRFGMACANCHGGAPGVGSTDGFGWIHGTNQTFYVGYTTTTRNAYRFMNGGSMRFWDPNGWNTSTGTCWTLGGTGRPADQWGGCTKHSGSATNDRKAFRPLTY